MIHIPNAQVRISPYDYLLNSVLSQFLFRCTLFFRNILTIRPCLTICPCVQDALDDNGKPMQDPKRWHGYCGRCFLQLEWWAEAAKEHKLVEDPFAKSKPFQSSPSQRNAPLET